MLSMSISDSTLCSLERFIDNGYFIMKKNNAYYLNGGYIMALDDCGLIGKESVDSLTTQNQRRYNESK